MKKLNTALILSMLLTAGCATAESSLFETEKLNLQVETLVDDLQNPWAMAFLPNGDLLLTERPGRLRIVRNGKLQSDPIGGVPQVLAGGQGGLLDIELHPRYSEPGNDWIYLTYSSPAAAGEPGNGANTAVMRARLSGDTLVDQQQIFKALPNYPGGRHYGSRVVFDRNGFLFVTVGDRGSRDQVQRIDNPLGKIFRLHDDGRIPADNPFVDKASAMDAIWSTGHRNPQGLALHPVNGELWAHEHGPRGGDEINIIEKGNNYGWPVVTYGINYSGSKITDETSRPGLQQPIVYWDPSIAPCGISFVTSDKYPGWTNSVLVGSLKFQRVQRVEYDGRRIVHQEQLLEGIGRVRAIEQGPDGLIYIAAESPGRIIRLQPQ